MARLATQAEHDGLQPRPGIKEATRFAHDFSRIPLHAGPPVRVQTKLTVGSPGDAYEQEADRASEQVMRMPVPKSAGGCACPGPCGKCRGAQPNRVGRLVQTKRGRTDEAGQSLSSPLVDDVLRAPGQPLDAGARAFMEPRFGHDFSQVRVHTDDRAAKSAQSLRAQAYTAGHNIVFNSGRYSPHTHGGKQLLAHELAHIVQQDGDSQSNRISRFSDADHFILEEAALAMSTLSEDEIEEVHEGNKRRDYAQLSGAANLVLLCNPNNFGGTTEYEHFDNFRWDEELQQWQSRKGPATAGKKNPIDHIENELTAFVGALPKKTAFRHVGTAFHAVEDFFAHSNFIELTHDDFRHGNKLVTGSAEAPDVVSALRVAESISSRETAPLYGQQAEKETAKTPPQSHARMTKDYKSSPYHTEAMVLAALVVKDLAADISAMQALKDKEAQVKYVREVLMAKVKRYLRPPDKQDPWWESLRASGGSQMERAVRKVEGRTPITQNQCILSPLRSIEASADSNLKLLGPTFVFPTENSHVFLQMGTGFATGPAFAGRTGEVEPRSAQGVLVGAQVVARFW